MAARGATGAGAGVGERDLRAELLVAAAELVAEHGPGAVSLREIARRCGVSHAAPAHHFRDRAALLSAVAAEGFRGLAGALGDVEGATARDRLAAQGQAYVTFAVGAPGHFPVMFRPELLDETDAELLEARMTAFAELDGAVGAARAEGWASTASHEVAVVTAWSIVHGLATLWLDGTMPPHLTAQALDDLTCSVTDLLAGLDAPAVRGRRRGG